MQGKTQIFGRGRVRRSTTEGRESLDRADVVALRLGGETADGHVPDHAPAKRGDALLGHAILLSEARLLTPRSSDRSLPTRYRAPLKQRASDCARRATARRVADRIFAKIDGATQPIP